MYDETDNIIKALTIFMGGYKISSISLNKYDNHYDMYKYIFTYVV